MIWIPCKLLDPKCKPARQTAGAVGYDLVAREPGTLAARGRATIPVGVCLAIPDGYEGQVRPRSGLARAGVMAVLGVIDSDYRGEISVTLYNHTDAEVQVALHQRIAQLVISPAIGAVFSEAVNLPTTERNDKGFGSTG